MTYKQILVEIQLHNQVKAVAALQGKSIREFTEEALREQLAAFSLPRVVKESTETYDTSTAGAYAPADA